MRNAEIPKGNGKNLSMDIRDLPLNQQKIWCDLVDDVVEASEFDNDLKEGFQYLNDKAFDRGITIYQLILEAYEKNEFDERISNWVKEKGYK